MENLGYLTFPIIITIVVILVVIAIALDKERIKKEIEKKGGHILFIRWEPFGKGWFGDSNRIYRVRYKDNNNEIERWCKTSLFSEVYYSDD